MRRSQRKYASNKPESTPMKVPALKNHEETRREDYTGKNPNGDEWQHGKILTRKKLTGRRKPRGNYQANKTAGGCMPTGKLSSSKKTTEEDTAREIPAARQCSERSALGNFPTAQNTLFAGVMSQRGIFSSRNYTLRVE